MGFYIVLTMFCFICLVQHKKKTFNQYKNCSLDKTGEGNVVSDLAISAQKYPKIVTQEKQNSRNPQQWFLKLCCFFTEF